jgi:hypothetical protein
VSGPASPAAREAGSGNAAADGPAAAPRVYRLRSPHPAEAVLAACVAAIDGWGGEWTARDGGGELRLPVQAGLRRGLASGRATASRSGGGCELALEIAGTTWWLDRSAVLLLTTAALAAAALVLWPFFPALAKLAPLGLVLGAGAWLVILARLRHEGPAELLAQVEKALEGRAAPAAPPPPVAPR